VKRILRRRLSPVDGEPEYETWWEGHPEAEASWEPVESFAGCPGLPAAFERGLEVPAAAARGGNRHGNAEASATTWLADILNRGDGGALGQQIVSLQSEVFEHIQQEV
jgi:hypothetical protein